MMKTTAGPASLCGYLRTFLSVVVLMCFSDLHLIAQISPGPLAEVHADLEGMSNCTRCHTIGEKVENAKCLQCHDALRSRIDAGEGYHVSAEVRGQDCFKCHSEHHGRKFEMVRFDVEHFDHDLTGYPLTGAHRQLNCAECHQPDFIQSRELRQRSGTYLGLNTACTTCHTDFHQGTLSNNCTKCHTTDAFVPASAFSHDKTDFPLVGAHQTVDCVSCHKVTTRNGSSFQEFADVPFTNCSSCHEDVHQGRFGTNCKECHVEESFHVFRGMGDFNHNKTGFPLLGKHQTISCADCHSTQVSTDRMFKDFTGKDVSNCTACHEDVHKQKFGNDCRTCHSEESFRAVRNFTVSDHSKTAYPLEGKHETVDCRKCHETRMMLPLAHSQCADCHADFHEGQFVTATRTPDCAECHTVNGFAGSTFTVEEHNRTDFVLTGAHLATPCFACHQRNDKWVFRDVGNRCTDCHEDVHGSSIDARYYPDKACERCHTPDAWNAVQFDHSLTGFALAGRHAQVACTACHIPDSTLTGKRHVAFNGLVQECTSCHANVHREQFAVDGITDCRRCHGFEHWKPSEFDHNTARFVLEGAHLEVACAQCHKAVADDQGSYVLFRLEKFACADCHE